MLRTTALCYDLVGEDVVNYGRWTDWLLWPWPIAKHVGARNVVITDVNDYRLGIAKQMGATRAINVSRKSTKDVMGELNND